MKSGWCISALRQENVPSMWIFRATSLDWSNPRSSKTKKQHYIRWTRGGKPDLLSTWIYRVYTAFLQIIFCQILRKSLSKAIISVGRAGLIVMSWRKKSLNCCNKIVFIFILDSTQSLTLWTKSSNQWVSWGTDRLFKEGRALGQRERKSSENQRF